MKSEYDIPLHRYYELKHYCLQYPDWVEMYKSNIGCGECSGDDPTATQGVKRADILRNIELVDRICREAAGPLYNALRAFVTQGKRETSNYSSEAFWSAYRRFYWLLDREKGL